MSKIQHLMLFICYNYKKQQVIKHEKRERLEEITRLVNQKGTIRVSDIVKLLNVTDMTVRRDLVELEEQGVLTKIHGGARSNKSFPIP